MSTEIVSREDERASLRAFLDREDGPAALVLEGEAGIGKSTLWSAGVDDARARGYRILSARPAEPEQALAYAGLGDLFESVLDDVLPALAPPRRRALEVALLLEDAGTDAADPRALAVAVHGALELLAADGPVLVAIDDVQWFDDPSSGALAFALRRAAPGRVLVMLARRTDASLRRTDLELALGSEHVERLPVGPLSVGALHQLLRDRLGRFFARQTLLRIHDRSGGNPFFALELARVVDAELDPLAPLPVPETLDDLLRTRISGLPRSTREALEIAAAIGTPTDAVLERAGVSADALDAAVAARVVERENGTIRFSHPLLSSVLYSDLGDARRVVHRRLAEIVGDPLARARHLALSAHGPDAAVAARLDDAARLAVERGAWATAAELGEQALRLTPATHAEDHRRRGLAAARAHRHAGEWTRARSIVADVLDETDGGSFRAQALVLLAELESVDRRAELLEEALREASSEPRLECAIQCRLADAMRFRKGFVETTEHARAALALAEALGDDSLRVEALLKLVFLGSSVGDPEAGARAARAHELATALGDDELVRRANDAVAEMHVLASELDAARELLARAYDEWCERDELSSADVLWSLSWVELRSCHWRLAADHAARAREIHVQYGLEIPQDHVPIAFAALYLGELEKARRHSELALVLAQDQLGLHPPFHLGILGLAALWDGDPATGVEWLEKADAQAARLGWREPRTRPWAPDHVEALLELDRREEAVRILEAWEADAVLLQREWALAHAARCRGLVAAAAGDVDGAIVLLEEAVGRHENAADPFGRARAQLGLGIALRRARQKRASREAIAAALDGFERLGAATWAERAGAELGRIGGRTRQDELTAAERRVAALVAEGRTNREVAAALFLGERTVESHLTHIYAKLGVRSRTELARRLHDVAA